MAETTIIRNDLHRSELAVANGVASLDGSGKIPSSQISISSIINDSGTTSSDIWSANKTQTQINSAVVGLLDDRGNYTPAGSYPTTGGSGTAGAILKGDIWQISGLGAGVSALMDTRVVFDGDWVRALIDDPGQTDANWSESVTSSSNLGNANLVSADNARTFTLKSGGTATQNLQIVNSAGKKGFYFNGASQIGLLTSTFNAIGGGESTNLNMGDATDPVAIAMHFSTAANKVYYALTQYVGANTLHRTDARGFFLWQNQANNANTDIQFTLVGGGARIMTNTPSTSLWQVGYGHYYNGTPQVQIATDNNTNGYITVHKFDGTVNNIISGRRAYEATWFAEGIVLGGARYRAATPFFDVMGAGSTSATKTALFQNSSSLKSLEIFDSGGINFGSNTISGGEGYAFGVQNTVGSSTAFASGYLNIVNAYYAAAFGRENNITNYCFAAGYGNTISATVSFAFGQGNIVSGSNSLVTGSSNGASGLNSFVYGGNSAVTSNYSMSGGLYATATGNNSVAIGLGYAPQAHNQLIAGGTASFIFSAKNASSVPNTGAMANYSFILGGLNHSVVSGATSSGIIGGEGNTINASVVRSVILGGSAITATASDTAYAININATTLITTPQVITTPATITVAANAGTVTRANRINNFTNSSAATMTITMSTTAALDGDLAQVRIYDFSAATQTITWVNTENSSITVPATSNGSTTLPLTVGFQYNSATSKWRCIGSV